MASASKPTFFKTLALFFKVLLRQLKTLRTYSHRKPNNAHIPFPKLQKYCSLVSESNHLSSHTTLIFDVEKTLLRSLSLFPYFMLVALEAGSPFRGLLLLALCPLVCLVNEEMGIKIMVMVSFFGIKEERFREGRAVLPKFFLEDVGLEGFELLRRCGGRKVGVSKLPQVMVECFLREYLGIECVVGRQLKVYCGYFVGVMEEESKANCFACGEMKISADDDVTGICGYNSLNHHLLSHCKEIYSVNQAEKREWHTLPKGQYPKPLVFHDGRLAIRPTPSTTLAIFMWIPFGLFLSVTRVLITLTLPRKVSLPLLVFTGLHVHFTHSLLNVDTNRKKPGSDPLRSRNGATAGEIQDKKRLRGVLYVSNHRTLLDPLYLSFILNKPLTAVTYSLSRVSEVLAPIRTFRLKRDRDQDAQMMQELLGRGDVAVCPEGTTCREPYLLRFSPLFSEIADIIVPVALDSDVSMFHGTTAGGFKCFDPLFFLMNPCPTYTVRLLPEALGSSKPGADRESRFQIANQVQREIGEALGFECTKFTRKDKYLTLAGNEGIVCQ